MLEFYLYMFIYMFKVSVWLMHVSCTLLFIVHYWVTTKHILIPDSSVSFFLPLLLLWRGRAIKVGSGRVRQGMWACRESARGSSAPWEKKLRGILEGRKGKKEEKNPQRGARAPRPAVRTPLALRSLSPRNSRSRRHEAALWGHHIRQRHGRDHRRG